MQGEPWVPGEAVGKAPHRPFSGLRVSRGGVLVTPGFGRGPWTKPRSLPALRTEPEQEPKLMHLNTQAS